MSSVKLLGQRRLLERAQGVSEPAVHAPTLAVRRDPAACIACATSTCNRHRSPSAPRPKRWRPGDERRWLHRPAPAKSVSTGFDEELLGQVPEEDREAAAKLLAEPGQIDRLLAAAFATVGTRMKSEAAAAREVRRSATGKIPTAAAEFLAKGQALSDAIAEKLAQVDAAQTAVAEAVGKLALRTVRKTITRDADGLIASVEETEDFDYPWDEPAELGAAVVDVLAAAVLAIGPEGVKTLNARVAELQRVAETTK